MIKEQGRATLTDRVTGNVVAECSTFQCAHCQFVVHVPVKCSPTDLGGLCGHCAGLICPRCVGKPCVPFMKKLEDEEARYDALRSYGL